MPILNPLFSQKENQIIDVAIKPVENLLHSLMLITEADMISGLGEWVYNTAHTMTYDERQDNLLVLIGLHYAVQPVQSFASFPAYLDNIQGLNPNELKSRLLNAYYQICKPGLGDPEKGIGQPVDESQILSSSQAYVNFLKTRFGEEAVNEELETRAYHYVIHPAEMHRLIVQHMRMMWETYLKPEWDRTRQVVLETTRAFQQSDLEQMDRIELVRFVTGRDPEEKKANSLRSAEKIVFVPNPHIGPYQHFYSREKTILIFFGPRLPEGSRQNFPTLSRAELLVRLGTLADDTRLAILKLIADQEELCSQDIIEALDLTQSTASRQLSQLTAAGFLSERRLEGAKCFRISSKRVEDTVQALMAYLSINR